MPDPLSFASFLRARRERVSPLDVGLKPSTRRRTPGLRREELATLAGVSIDYLVRLEQGRDVHPSPAVLSALADALLLGDDDRRHLFALAAHAASPELCPSAPVLVDRVSPAVQRILDQLDPMPAFVVGPIGDVVASNAAWHALAGPLGYLDEPNLARHVFCHPQARAVHPDWDADADAVVARLRRVAPRLADDDGFRTLLADLEGVPGFAERWSAHAVEQKRRGVKRLVHPVVGELHLTYEAMALADHDQQLITWLAADEATAAAVRTALAVAEPVSPAVLRVVAGT